MEKFAGFMKLKKEFLHEEGIWLTPVLINSKLVLVGGDKV